MGGGGGVAEGDHRRLPPGEAFLEARDTDNSATPPQPSLSSDLGPSPGTGLKGVSGGISRRQAWERLMGDIGVHIQSLVCHREFRLKDKG